MPTLAPVEVDLLQQRGCRPPHQMRILFTPPLDPHIATAVVDGGAAPELVDGDLTTTTAHGPPVQVRSPSRSSRPPGPWPDR